MSRPGQALDDLAVWTKSAGTCWPPLRAGTAAASWCSRIIVRTLLTVTPERGRRRRPVQPVGDQGVEVAPVCCLAHATHSPTPAAWDRTDAPRMHLESLQSLRVTVVGLPRATHGFTRDPGAWWLDEGNLVMTSPCRSSPVSPPPASPAASSSPGSPPSPAASDDGPLPGGPPRSRTPSSPATPPPAWPSASTPGPRELRALNHLGRHGALYVGQRIRIPVVARRPAGPHRHTATTQPRHHATHQQPAAAPHAASPSRAALADVSQAKVRRVVVRTARAARRRPAPRARGRLAGVRLAAAPRSPRAGAIGAMQVLPGTGALDVAVRRPAAEPAYGLCDNVTAGVLLLKRAATARPAPAAPGRGVLPGARVGPASTGSTRRPRPTCATSLAIQPAPGARAGTRPDRRRGVRPATPTAARERCGATGRRVRRIGRRARILPHPGREHGGRPAWTTRARRATR